MNPPSAALGSEHVERRISRLARQSIAVVADARASAGVQARVLYSMQWFGDTSSDIDERHSVIAPALLFSLTYH